MADFDALKAQIAALIPDNTEQAITAKDVRDAFGDTIDAINTAKEDEGAIAPAQWGGITGDLDDQTDLKNALDAKYVKPSAGIPGSDLDNGVRSDLNKARSAVQPGDLALVASTGDYDDLLDKPTIPAEIDTVNVTVDNNTGTPSATGSVSGSTLSLAFSNLKGATGATGATGPQGPQGPQGNPGSSQDYPFTLANNLTTDDSTVALTAAQGVVLGGEISQLGQELNGYAAPWDAYTTKHLYRSSASFNPRIWVASDNYTLRYIPIASGDTINVTWKGTTDDKKGRRLIVANEPVATAECTNLLDSLSNTEVTEQIVSPADGYFCINTIFNTLQVEPVALSINGVDQFASATGIVDRLDDLEDAVEQLQEDVEDMQADLAEMDEAVNGYAGTQQTASVPATSGSSIGKSTKYPVTLKAGKVYRVVMGGDTSTVSAIAMYIEKADASGISGTEWYPETPARRTGSYISFSSLVQDITLRCPVDAAQVSFYSSAEQVTGSGTLSFTFTLEEVRPLGERVACKLDKHVGINLYDKSKALVGFYINSSGAVTIGSSSQYGTSDYIPVNGQDIISNAETETPGVKPYVVYDADKGVLRTGDTAQYTYHDGDAFVVFTFRPWVSGQANYGTTLAPYAPYTDNGPVEALDARVSALEDRVGTVDYNYTSVALFKSIAVVGDSYSCGAIYGVTGAADGRYDGMAWANIMARHNGIQGVGLYATPSQNTSKFLDSTDSRYATYGLGAMLADTAKDLYFVMLGINAEPEGVGIGTIADCNEDWTLNAASFYGNYGKIIGNIKAHAPSAKIVCIVPNMLFSNGNPAVNDSKKEAILEVAEFYGVPAMEALVDSYFSSTFYKSMLSTNHPVGVTYAGMALAFERLLSACIQANGAYFQNYVYS